jgi:phosphatidylserine/phosphatidylglycerophosphate/cardiolipin synthase-like enzyme
MFNRKLSYLAVIALISASTTTVVGCGGPTGEADPGIIDNEMPGELSLGSDGKADYASYDACLVQAILDRLNDPALTESGLAGTKPKIGTRAARYIFEFRLGTDGVFDDLEEVDSVKWVGKGVIGRLADQVDPNCDEPPTPPPAPNASADVVFSPAPYQNSHVTKAVEWIQSAQYSVDLAMYSMSNDSRIQNALSDALDRGVAVRVIFHQANDDRKADPEDLAGTKSAKLEARGVDVRWVNKIMHHKFLLVDGPTLTMADGSQARLVTGSANWSTGGATRYDENTIFLTQVTELAYAYQSEFNLMWNHSKDFVFDDTLVYNKADELGAAPSDDNTDSLFTSANFKVSSAGTTFSRIRGMKTVADGIVAEIEKATQSIYVASGHLRSRHVYDALVAAKAANPSLDIRIYTDGQEYISEWGQNNQDNKRASCLVNAGESSNAIEDCLNKGYYYSLLLGQAGIDLRFKYYAYRWDYSYAPQMHNKFFIIDGETLLTGSYNLSDNAEGGTFENMAILRAPQYGALIAAFEARFLDLWDTRASGQELADLRDEIATDSTIPLTFKAMALTWQEVTELKSLIRSNCSLVDSDSYRKHPEVHTTCPR